MVQHSSTPYVTVSHCWSTSTDKCGIHLPRRWECKGHQAVVDAFWKNLVPNSNAKFYFVTLLFKATMSVSWTTLLWFLSSFCSYWFSAPDFRPHFDQTSFDCLLYASHFSLAIIDSARIQLQIKCMRVFFCCTLLLLIGLHSSFCWRVQSELGYGCINILLFECV